MTEPESFGWVAIFATNWLATGEDRTLYGKLVLCLRWLIDDGLLPREEEFEVVQLRVLRCLHILKQQLLHFGDASSMFRCVDQVPALPWIFLQVIEGDGITVDKLLYPRFDALIDLGSSLHGFKGKTNH